MKIQIYHFKALIFKIKIILDTRRAIGFMYNKKMASAALLLSDKVTP